MYNRKIILLTLIVATIFFFTRCFHRKAESDPRGPAYAGAAACVHCHSSISRSFAHTAHFLSTRIADSLSVEGNFSKFSNQLLVNDSTKIVMEKRDSGYYQVLYMNNMEKQAHRFDLVMGAVKGQTYLYWKEKGFFELPVSYFYSLKTWTSSPGYSFTDIHFNRPVVKACFECHSSFASESEPQGIAGSTQENKWILNIDCERCHGPAAAHVAFQEEHPEDKLGRYLVSYKSLSRERKIDLCAVCHSGTKHVRLKSTFTFKMGDTLSTYIFNVVSGHQEPDVHGNQTQLLSESKCYRMSTMDCATCHNTHVNDRGLVKTYNEHCQGCHSPGKHFCAMETESNREMILDNCTHCHMPAQASKSILVQLAKNTVAIPTMVVNHHIGIYPEESNKVAKTK